MKASKASSGTAFCTTSSTLSNDLQAMAPGRRGNLPHTQVASSAVNAPSTAPPLRAVASVAAIKGAGGRRRSQVKSGHRDNNTSSSSCAPLLRSTFLRWHRLLWSNW
eukprot:1021984-Amphidinium_carterae.1